MFSLSRGHWLRVWFAANLSELRVAYAQELLEELEQDGLVWVDYAAWPRWIRWTERMINGRNPTIAQELRAGLTDKGREHPPLLELLEEAKQMNRDKARMTHMNKPQMAVVYGSVAISVLMVLLSFL